MDSPEQVSSGPASVPLRGAEPGTGSLEAAPDAGRAGWRRRSLIGLAAALALAVVAAVVLWTGPLRPDRPAGTVALSGIGAAAASG